MAALPVVTYGESILRKVLEPVETFEAIEAEVDEEDRYEITADTIEAAVLDETRNRRKFRRLLSDELNEILST